MFKNKIFLGILGLAVIGIIFYSLSGGKNELANKSYFAQIQEERKALNEDLKNNADSPIEDKSLFKGLNYFEPDTTFRVIADYQVVSEDKQSNITMTDSTKGELKQVAVASMTINGKTIKLGLFKEGDIFFLPFRDLTNGKETYGGGRYINIPATNLNENKILIDFNESHNFYCAYNHTYVCPVPPADNKIEIEINAGEKVLNYNPQTHF